MTLAEVWWIYITVPVSAVPDLTVESMARQDAELSSKNQWRSCCNAQGQKQGFSLFFFSIRVFAFWGWVAATLEPGLDAGDTGLRITLYKTSGPCN